LRHAVVEIHYAHASSLARLAVPLVDAAPGEVLGDAASMGAQLVRRR
jgi:hypothetical protein